MDFAQQKTEGACESLIGLVFSATKTRLHAGSLTRLRRELPPGGSLVKICSQGEGEETGCRGRHPLQGNRKRLRAGDKAPPFRMENLRGCVTLGLYKSRWRFRHFCQGFRLIFPKGFDGAKKSLFFFEKRVAFSVSLWYSE